MSATAVKRPARPKVSPREYAEFIRGLDLLNIAARALSAELLVDKVDFKREMDLGIEDKVSFQMEGEATCKVIQTCVFMAAYKDEPKIPLLRISCTFEVVYRVAKPMTKDYFQIFCTNNLPLNTWPYFREYVQSTVVRMGLPPLVLPVVRR
ncbi:MAG TPA: hypothetical protein VMH22_12020 [bacterium]|nr:hypothetical protein [bacterium]